MKRKNIYLGISVFIAGVLMTSCGPLVVGPPNAVIGGGIYPAPVMVPPPGGPGVFRPGGPNGPGFAPGGPGGPAAPMNNPGGPGGPGGGPGGPGGPMSIN